MHGGVGVVAGLAGQGGGHSPSPPAASNALRQWPPRPNAAPTSTRQRRWDTPAAAGDAGDAGPRRGRRPAGVEDGLQRLSGGVLHLLVRLVATKRVGRPPEVRARLDGLLVALHLPLELGPPAARHLLDGQQQLPQHGRRLGGLHLVAQPVRHTLAHRDVVVSQLAQFHEHVTGRRRVVGRRGFPQQAVHGCERLCSGGRGDRRGRGYGSSESTSKVRG